MSMNASHRLNNFDLIRLFAAMEVVFAHTHSWLKIPVNPYLVSLLSLFPGVAIFFVISGFLITKSYVENGGNLKRYIVSRMLRIYPGLWVNLSVIVLLLYVTGGITSESIFSIKFVLWGICSFFMGIGIGGHYLFDLTNFYKVFPSGVLWTISVEIGFYMIVPIIFYRLISNKQQKRSNWSYIFLAGYCTSIVFAILNAKFIHQDAHTTISMLLELSILPYLWIFLVGSLMFVKWDIIHKYIQNKFIIWLVVYIVFSLVSSGFNRDLGLDFKSMSLLNAISIFLLALCVISFAYSFNSLHFLNGKIDLSYGTYLYHMQIVYTLMYLGFLHSQYLWFVVYASTFTVAAISWFCVEKPAFKLKYFLIKSQKVNLKTNSTPAFSLPLENPGA